MARARSRLRPPMIDFLQLVLRARREARLLGAAPEDGEDLAQETALRVWQRVTRRLEIRNSGGALRTTLQRIRIDWWRRRPAPESGEVETLAAKRPSPVENASWKELKREVRVAISRLPETQRVVVRMRYFEGKTFKEIARTLEIPINTALGRMHLAAEKLRQTLGEFDEH